MCAPQIKSEIKANKISIRTIQRRSVGHGLYGSRPAKNPLLSMRNGEALLKFSKERLNWTIDDWKKMVR